jgi:hypothetical protein
VRKTLAIRSQEGIAFPGFKIETWGTQHLQVEFVLDRVLR